MAVFKMFAKQTANQLSSLWKCGQVSQLVCAFKKKKALCECSLAALVTMLLQEPGEGRAGSRGELGGGAGQAEAGQGGRVQEEPGHGPSLHENMTNV